MPVGEGRRPPFPGCAPGGSGAPTGSLSLHGMFFQARLGTMQRHLPARVGWAGGLGLCRVTACSSLIS